MSIDENKIDLNINKLHIEEDEADIDDLFKLLCNSEESKCDKEQYAIREDDVILNNNTDIDIEHEIEIRNALNLVEEMKAMISHIPYAKETLRNELSVLDKAQEDLLSKIENDKFNVVDGYKLVKKIKEIRIKRRTVKNNLYVYETLGNSAMPKIDTIDNVVEKAKNIEGDVRYKPRVLKNIDYKFNDNKNSKFKDIKRGELLSVDYLER